MAFGIAAGASLSCTQQALTEAPLTVRRGLRRQPRERHIYRESCHAVAAQPPFGSALPGVYPFQSAMSRRVAVLLIEADVDRRTTLSNALRQQGMSVQAVGGIAEVERWPTGDVVITDSRRFTPFWKETGAAYVVVLADSDDEGENACTRGANAWIPRSSAATGLIDVLYELGILLPEPMEPATEADDDPMTQAH